jgi:hypothetical protein
MKRITLQCETLDAWVSWLGVNEIDFIKIDVEGHEIQGGPVSTKIAAPADLHRRIFN